MLRIEPQYLKKLLLSLKFKSVLTSFELTIFRSRSSSDFHMSGTKFTKFKKLQKIIQLFFPRKFKFTSIPYTNQQKIKEIDFKHFNLA